MEPILNNLPLQLSSFIGREREIADIERLLTTARLMTLTGASGCGKPRLALEVAGQTLDSYGDGAWFVDLAPLSDPTLLTQRLASTLAVHDQPFPGGGKPVDLSRLKRPARGRWNRLSSKHHE